MSRIIGLIFFVAVVCMSSTTEKDSSLAEVNKIQGAYIFVDSEPVGKYEYLGTVNITLSFSNQYEPVRDILIKKARKKYGNSFDGLIFHFTNGGTDKADVIKFED